MTEDKPIALITGATSGIGKASAELLAGKYRLILCGRRAERLSALKKELPTDVQTLSFDVRNRSEVFQSIESLPEAWKTIDILINKFLPGLIRSILSNEGHHHEPGITILVVAAGFKS